MNNTISTKKPSVSIVVPGYNEASIIDKNLGIICEYMKSIETEYDWEIIFINDGSKDNTKEVAENFAKNNSKVFVYNHKVNLFLGHALRTGFKHAKGDYIIPLDIDLSYSPDHIKRLLDEIVETEAQVVIASPYMKGGKVSNVPFFRKHLSKIVNKFLSIIVREKIYTFTGMVRAYERKYLKYLNLKARDTEINPEIIYKSLLLRARVVEIPAHLNWSFNKKKGAKRKSSLKMIRGIMSGFMSGFIFRPYIFFIIVGLLLLLVAFYVIGWIFINTLNVYPQIHSFNSYFDDRFSTAVSQIFRQRPQAFFIGGLTLVIALQFLSLGFLSLQSKRYFEELFHLNTNIYKLEIEKKEEETEKL